MKYKSRPTLTFKQQKKLFKKGERIAGKLLKNQYGVKIIFSDSDHQYYDFITVNQKEFRTTTVEVKEDLLCGYTGNVLIEYSRGLVKQEPSAISVSAADIWIIRVHRCGRIDNLLIKTALLRQLIRDGKHWKSDNVKKTGNNCHFFKYEILEEASYVIFPEEIPADYFDV